MRMKVLKEGKSYRTLQCRAMKKSGKEVEN